MLTELCTARIGATLPPLKTIGSLAPSLFQDMGCCCYIVISFCPFFFGYLKDMDSCSLICLIGPFGLSRLDGSLLCNPLLVHSALISPAALNGTLYTFSVS